MKATALLARQLTGVNALLHHVADDLSQQEWISRPLCGENMPGFIVWHLPRLQDHLVQLWIRGLSEFIQDERWACWNQLQPLGAGLGITLEEADQIAHCVQPAEVLAYADAILHEMLSWLNTLTEDELECIPDARKHLAPYPEYQTSGHYAETDDLLDLPIWRLLSGPCIGHLRGHLGELALIKSQLRVGVR
jgi:hypothetical protein